jgi:hypothetical protein
MQFSLNNTRVKDFGFTQIAQSTYLITFNVLDESLYAEIESCTEQMTLIVHPTLDGLSIEYEYRFHECAIEACDGTSFVILSSYMRIYDVRDVRKSKIENYLKDE